MITRTASLDEELDLLFASEPGALAHAPEIWRRLRDEAPVHRHGPVLLVSRHEDVKPLLAADVASFGKGGAGSTQAQEQLAALGPEEQAVFRALLDFESLFMSRTTDAERHDRLRRIAHRAFTPRRIEAVRASVEAYADELVAELAAHDDADLAGFAYRFPLTVIAGMLGVPRADHDLLHEWSVKMAGSTVREPAPLRAGLAAVQEFRAYVGGIVEQHRRDPGSVSELVAAMLDAEEDERLSADELAAMFVVLIFAGHETTTNLIAIGITELLRRREQWELLAADPSRAAAATEELLRFVTPVQVMPRVAGRPIAAGGVDVEAGQSVLLVLSAANRDPEVFSEPEALKIERSDARAHLALGFGPRFCLGAALARLEGEAAFGRLAAAFPRMTLADGPTSWQGPAMLRKPTSVRVRLRG